MCGYRVILNERDGEVGDLMLSTVKGVESLGGLVAFFCFLLLRARSFCSFILMDDLRVSDSSEVFFSRFDLDRSSALRLSESESEVKVFKESLE